VDLAGPELEADLFESLDRREGFGDLGEAKERRRHAEIV
jgi:hypothetical protein